MHRWIVLGLLFGGCGGGGEVDAGIDARSVDGGAIDGGAIDGGGAEDAPGSDTAPADDAGTDAPPARCTLTTSGPVRVTTDGAVVEDLHIVASGEAALVVEADDVVIRRVWIEHEGGAGIVGDGAARLHIEDVVVEHTGAPASGAHASADDNNIQLYQCPSAVIERVRLTRGSTGIYVQESPDVRASFVEGHDFRGPFPRGQLMQFNASDRGLLEDFSVINPAGSWPEDNVNVYQSSEVTIRRGLVDGNNSPSGVGVIFDGGDATGLVEDVDAVHMGNGCFSAYAGGDGSIFRRTRCRDNLCGDQGRGTPGSNGLMWAGQPGLSALRIEASTHYAACNPGNIYWPGESFAVVELVEEDFTPRAPIVLSFCWE